MSCVFCDRIERGEYQLSDEFAVAFEPLRAVTQGHLLVVPKRHVENAGESPQTTARTMYLAAEIVQGQVTGYNLITSGGPDSTQTVMHLHIHIVPRRPWNGLALPWTSQRRH